jgi:hypothetical protein
MENKMKIATTYNSEMNGYDRMIVQKARKIAKANNIVKKQMLTIESLLIGLNEQEIENIYNHVDRLLEVATVKIK